MSEQASARGRTARIAELVLTLLASAVFVVLWVYVALVAFTDSSLPDDTWAWLSGLELVPAIIAWIAILPLGVFLWAAQANLDTIAMAVVMLGLVAWTFVAWSGLGRVLWRRRSATGGPGPDG